MMDYILNASLGDYLGDGGLVDRVICQGQVWKQDDGQHKAA